MSFLAGPECSIAANPLSQFTKHTQADTSLQRDRVSGNPALNSLRESFRTQDGSEEYANRTFNEFLSQPAILPNMALPEFDMAQIRQEMESLGPRALRTHQPPAMWASEMKTDTFQNQTSAVHIGQQPALIDASRYQQHEARDHSPYSADEFASFQVPTSSQIPSDPLPGLMLPPLQQPSFVPPMMYNTPFQSQMFSGPSMHFNRQFDQPQQSTGKGKERMVELDDNEWEAQFAQLEETTIKQQTTAQPSQSETLHNGDLDSLWRGILSEHKAGDLQTDPRVKVDLSDLENPNEWTDFDTPSFAHTRAFDEEAISNMGAYQFEEGENPFASHSNPYHEGLTILRSHGNLTLAALAFEAAVQADPSHQQAWLRLGQTQASNEMETQAIRALERSLELDAQSPEALMSLAISYTNESYDQLSLRTLEKWLSVRYPALQSPQALTPEAHVGVTDPEALRARVTNQFIRAAQAAPSGAAMDPDVQIGLGVLFYTAGTYSKAIDCFQAALESTEQSFHTDETSIHLLWNRLGATLANSARPEEAIAAYERALELNPSFTRARYNLGVSCINMGFMKEAVGHLLGALSMHQKGEEEGRLRAKEITGKEDGGVMGSKGRNKAESANLTETLMRVFRLMDRKDLMEMVGPGMDVEKFRGMFEF